jgi:hypothetical protein
MDVYLSGQRSSTRSSSCYRHFVTRVIRGRGPVGDLEVLLRLERDVTSRQPYNFDTPPATRSTFVGTLNLPYATNHERLMFKSESHRSLSLLDSRHTRSSYLCLEAVVGRFSPFFEATSDRPRLPGVADPSLAPGGLYLMGAWMRQKFNRGQ